MHLATNLPCLSFGASPSFESASSSDLVSVSRYWTSRNRYVVCIVLPAASADVASAVSWPSVTMLFAASLSWLSTDSGWVCWISGKSLEGRVSCSSEFLFCWSPSKDRSKQWKAYRKEISSEKQTQVLFRHCQALGIDYHMNILRSLDFCRRGFGGVLTLIVYNETMNENSDFIRHHPTLMVRLWIGSFSGDILFVRHFCSWKSTWIWKGSKLLVFLLGRTRRS